MGDIQRLQYRIDELENNLRMNNIKNKQIGRQQQIILNSRGVQTHDFTTTISPAIYLDPDGEYDVALLQGSLWYCWYNISAKLGNNRFRFLHEILPMEFVIPDGLYDIITLNAALLVGMKSCSTALRKYTWTDSTGTERARIWFSGNTATSKLIVNFKQIAEYDPEDQYNNIWWDLTETSSNTIGDLLGIEKNHRYSQTFEGQNSVNLENDVQVVNIGLSLTSNTIFEGQANSDVIYSFVPTIPPSYLINIEPKQLIFMPVTTNNIGHVRIHVFDNLGRDIDLHGEPTSFTIIIRRRA